MCVEFMDTRKHCMTIFFSFAPLFSQAAIGSMVAPDYFLASGHKKPASGDGSGQGIRNLNTVLGCFFGGKLHNLAGGGGRVRTDGKPRLALRLPDQLTVMLKDDGGRIPRL